MTERLHFHFFLSCIGEGNGNALQCSCLENPRDGGSLVGCRLWGHTESDMNEVTQQQQQQQPDSKFREASDNIPGLGRSSGEGNGNPLQ